MKRYNLIAGINRSGVIGVDGKLPWRFSEDMKHFKKVTISTLHYDTPYFRGYTSGGRKTPTHCVIMGHSTFKNTGYLHHRGNIILSKSHKEDPIPNGGDQTHYDIRNYGSWVESIDAACEAAEDYDEVWVIGGREIYSQFLEKDLIERMLITEIQTEYPQHGILFPEFIIKYNVSPFGSYHRFYVQQNAVNNYRGNAYTMPSWILHNTTIGKNGLIVHDFRRIGDEEE